MEGTATSRKQESRPHAAWSWSPRHTWFLVPLSIHLKNTSLGLVSGQHLVRPCSASYLRDFQSLGLRGEHPVLVSFLYRGSSVPWLFSLDVAALLTAFCCPCEAADGSWLPSGQCPLSGPCSELLIFPGGLAPPDGCCRGQRFIKGSWQ